MIDLHCHVLPGIDDGPTTLEDSIDLARVAHTAGVRTIVATPHVSWRYRNSPETIRHAVETVQTAVRKAGIAIDIRRGAEIAVPRLEDLTDDELCALRLGDGPWLMIESPLSGGVADLESILDTVHRRGHWIVLAHPERSPIFRRDPDRLAALVSKGMLCSITASSLVGAFGRETRSFALALIHEGMVHNVTSDAHGATHRPPILRDDILSAAAYVPELLARAEWMTSEIPEAILSGDVLPKPPATDTIRRRRPPAPLAARPPAPLAARPPAPLAARPPAPPAVSPAAVSTPEPQLPAEPPRPVEPELPAETPLSVEPQVAAAPAQPTASPSRPAVRASLAELRRRSRPAVTRQAILPAVAKGLLAGSAALSRRRQATDGPAASGSPDPPSTPASRPAAPQSAAPPSAAPRSPEPTTRPIAAADYPRTVAEPRSSEPSEASAAVAPTPQPTRPPAPQRNEPAPAPRAPGSSPAASPSAPGQGKVAEPPPLTPAENSTVTAPSPQPARARPPGPHRNEPAAAPRAPGSSPAASPSPSEEADFCEIRWARVNGRSEFQAVRLRPGDGARSLVARSPEFRWRLPVSPDATPASTSAHAALVRQLLAIGWQPLGRSGALHWYEDRFRAQPSPSTVRRAAATPRSVCEIKWVKAKGRSEFHAVATGPDGTDLLVGRSPSFRWRLPVSPDATPAATAAHETLVSQLLAAGWQALERGGLMHWYGERFRSPDPPPDN